MPQLNIHDWPPQLFWLAVTFLALYFIVSRLVVPRTGGVIQARRERIESDLLAAQQLKGDTDRAIAAYEASLAEARQKAHAIVQEARERLGAETDKERATLDAALARKIEEAEATIAQSRQRALADVAAVAQEIAADIVDRLLGTRPRAEEVRAAVTQIGAGERV